MGNVAACGKWYIDKTLATSLIERAKARATKICVDYEHQTLRVAANGQAAPAAAWIDQATLEWVEGEGLFGMAALTQRGREAVESDEYRYFSPVFVHDPATGAVLDLLLGAFTNFPSIDGMQPLMAAASVKFAADLAALSQDLSATHEEQHMEELLEQLRWMLNLPVGATADDIKAQLQKLMDQIKSTNPDAVAAASFDLAAHLTAQGTQIAALNQQVAAAGVPDPAQFAPIAVVTELQGRLAALSQKTTVSEVDALVKQGIDNGQIFGDAHAEWARQLGRKDLAALSQFIGAAPKVPAVAGSQTNGLAPAAVAAASQTLDESMLAVCSMMGNDPAQVKQTMEGK